MITMIHLIATDQVVYSIPLHRHSSNPINLLLFLPPPPPNIIMILTTIKMAIQIQTTINQLQ